MTRTIAKRDQNDIPVGMGVSSVDLNTPLQIRVDPVTNRLLVDITTENPIVDVIIIVSAFDFLATIMGQPYVNYDYEIPDELNVGMVITGGIVPRFALGTSIIAIDRPGHRLTMSANANATSPLIFAIVTGETTVPQAVPYIAFDKRDQNQVPTKYGVSSTDGITLVPIRTDTNGKLLVQLT